MKKGFTLAEVLITLAIIGVVAAITIPSVIVNTNQMEFKTGLRKAVSVLNQAITLNKALTGEGPYDNSDLYRYLQQNMSVMKGRIVLAPSDGSSANLAFFTTDGMRYEFPTQYNGLYLHESGLKLQTGSSIGQGEGGATYEYGNCGSLGLAHNPDSTTTTPCLVVVDVNGDRKPSYSPVSYSNSGYQYKFVAGWSYYYMDSSYFSEYKIADPNGRLLSDVFSIMITDQGAIPYGVVAQKAMYQAQK